MLNLKTLRTQRGLSIKALSELSGISRRTLEDIEARGDCRISTAWAVCQALGCTLNDFYNDDHTPAQ